MAIETYGKRLNIRRFFNMKKKDWRFINMSRLIQKDIKKLEGY